MEGVNSIVIYWENFCGCHNAIILQYYNNNKKFNNDKINNLVIKVYMICTVTFTRDKGIWMANKLVKRWASSDIKERGLRPTTGFITTVKMEITTFHFYL
jgi:hypothetical protein